ARDVLRGRCLALPRAMLAVLFLGVVAAAVSVAGLGPSADRPLGVPPRLADGAEPSPRRKEHVDLHGDPLPPGATARLGTVRFRHGGGVTPLAGAPGGRPLAPPGGNRRRGPPAPPRGGPPGRRAREGGSPGARDPPPP